MGQNRQIELMRQARESGTFDPLKLAAVIWNNEATVLSRRAAFSRIESALSLSDNMKLPHVLSGLDRAGLYLEGIRRARVITDDMLTHNHSHFLWFSERYQLMNATPFGMNFLMFRKTIELQGTPEQKDYWLPRIDNMEINGAYVQTELGHGTFVRGIETTATFDQSTDEFVIGCPTATSVKYWPGGMGYSGSHAVVAARLITKGKDRGMHWFVVQIRSLEDYSPMEGVEVGDIGMKMAYNGTCNGYARFRGLRVPRSSMLAANAEVAADGSYTLRDPDGLPLSKRLYATMFDMRRVMIRGAAFAMAQALTIAARYSIVREQGRPIFAGMDGPETAIVEYKSQQYRLLTLTAHAYAILFASQDFDTLYERMHDEQQGGNNGSLSYTHALSTGLKAWNTTIAEIGAIEARKMCGGHGYVVLSGLPEIEATVSATCTFEGENYVMWQQLGRYLFKQTEQVLQGGRADCHVHPFIVGVEKYTRDAPHRYSLRDSRLEQLSSNEVLLCVFLHRAQRLLGLAYQDFTQMCKTTSPAKAWNTCMMTIITAAQAYTEYTILSSFQNRIAEISAAQPSLAKPLSNLCKLFAFTTILGPPSSFNGASFVEDGVFALTQLNQMRMHVNALLDELRPDLIILTDAWDFTDASLCSALGCRDGNAYERLMSWTRQLPDNDGRVVNRAFGGEDGIKEYIQRDRVVKTGKRCKL